MIDKATNIPYEAAVAMLRPVGLIHSFIPSGFGFAGADIHRSIVLDRLKNAERIYLSDPTKSMGHGIAIEFNHRWLLFETQESTGD